MYLVKPMTRTSMACFPWLVRTRFESLGNSSIAHENKYLDMHVFIKTSMTRTSMSCLPWLVRTRFEALGNSSIAQENKYLNMNVFHRNCFNCYFIM